MKRPDIGGAVDMRRHRGAAFKTGEMAIAAGFPFRLCRIKIAHLTVMQRGVKIAESKIAIDPMRRNPRGHEINRLHACLPGDVGILRRQLAADFREIAGPALAQMPAIASRSAGADPASLEHGNPEPRLGQGQRCRNAGQPATDDGHIGFCDARWPRIARPACKGGLIDAGICHDVPFAAGAISRRGVCAKGIHKVGSAQVPDQGEDACPATMPGWGTARATGPTRDSDRFRRCHNDV